MQGAIDEYNISKSVYIKRAEEDIINYAMLKMNLLEIFLKICEEKVRLDAKNF